MGKDIKTFRWDPRLQIQDFFMAFKRVPLMVVTLGQQYNIGEKPTVILYTYINRHAGTLKKQRKTKQNKKPSNMVVIIYCYIDCEVEVTTLLEQTKTKRTHGVDIVVVVVFTLKTVLTSIQYLTLILIEH